MTAGKDIFVSFLKDMSQYTGELKDAYHHDDWDEVYNAVSRIASACAAYCICVDMDKGNDE